MKYSFLALFFLLITDNYSEKSNLQDNQISINYETFTRGSIANYKVTPHKISIKKTGINEQEAELSTEEWNTIETELQKIQLSKLSSLSSPSEGRALDAALHAILSIGKNDTVFKSNTFDHGNPPLAVKQLVETILRLAENVE